MRILIVHPVMTYLGGGESLCCNTMRALMSRGDEITLLSETFDPEKIETFFGIDRLFDRINLLLYPSTDKVGALGTYSHIIQHLRGQKRALKQIKHSVDRAFDLIFSTQDAAYIPDLTLPVIQWGYFPQTFANDFARLLGTTVRYLPMRLHYSRKISRIGMVLAISEYSKWHFEREWKRPSVVVYPPCPMVEPRAKGNLVVTAGRAVPEKGLELFWKVAKSRPQYKFLMFAIRNPHYDDYAATLLKECPSNGRIVFNTPREAYCRLLGEARVYIHLMKKERFGITIVEAMSASCVPVVHDSGAPREIVDSQVGLLWQKVDDIPRMIDEGMKAAPSDAIRRRAEKFSRESFDKRLFSVFSELHA